MQHNITYTFLFAAAICVVCGVLVSTSAVSLSDRQEQNAALDKMKNVLTVSGLAQPGEQLRARRSRKCSGTRFDPSPIDLATGERTDAVDPVSYDQKAAAANPETEPPGAARTTPRSRGCRSTW